MAQRMPGEMRGSRVPPLLLQRQSTENLMNSKVAKIIMEATASVDVSSVIRVACGILMNMVDMYPYRTMNRQLIELRQELLQLDTKLAELEESDLDMQTSAQVLRCIRILASRAYAEVEREWAAHQVPSGDEKFLDLFFDSYDCPEKWKAITAVVVGLLKQLAAIAVDLTGSQAINLLHPSDIVVGSYGLITLGVIIDEDCDRVLRKGKLVQFPVSCAPNPVDSQCDKSDFVYLAETWTVDAEGNTGKLRKRKLSARVEFRTEGTSSDQPQVPRLYHITREPKSKKVGRYPKERYAFITSSSGILEAQVKSVIPNDPPVGCWGEPLVGAGTLLERGHTDYDTDDDYVSQDYAVDIILARTAVEGLFEEGIIRRLRVEGEKRFRETYYVCFVETSTEREVLAIYRHNKKHGMSLSTLNSTKDTRSDGLFHFLGVANHPNLRDLIVCAFVAMGLTSDL